MFRKQWGKIVFSIGILAVSMYCNYLFLKAYTIMNIVPVDEVVGLELPNSWILSDAMFIAGFLTLLGTYLFPYLITIIIKNGSWSLFCCFLLQSLNDFIMPTVFFFLYNGQCRGRWVEHWAPCNQNDLDFHFAADNHDVHEEGSAAETLTSRKLQVQKESNRQFYF